MDELLASQHELLGRISRTWENLKKAGHQNITIDLVKTSLSLLDSRWTRLEEQHSTLMLKHRSALKDNDYMKEDFLETAETQYTAQRAHLLKLERQYNSVIPAEAAAAKAPTTSAPAPSSSLPRLELPKFSGKFEDWPAFRDLFVSMVVEEPSLSNVRKLHYLKVSVLGEAESLIKNLPTTEENFERAWSTLKEHFENKRLLVRSYLNTFTSLPKMRPNSMTDLCKIFHGVMTTIGALKGIGRPIDSSEDLFVHMTVNLLDQATRREWDKTLRKSTDPPSFGELQAFLKEQMTSEEALAPKEIESAKRQLSSSKRAVCIAHQKPRSTNIGRPCPVCSGSHFLATCEQYLKKAPQEKKGLVATYNRCYNCLGRHAVSTCPSPNTCRTCSEKHHTTLHDAFTTASSTAKESASVNLAQHPSGEPPAVVLATVRVWVTDSKGQDYPVRALVDPGSETSLISESLAQRLRLPRTSASVAIHDVVGKQSSVARGRVTLTLSARDRSYTLSTTALILTRLTANNRSHAAGHRTWSHVQGLPLADPEFFACDPVEVLLGVQAYASIVMSGLRRGGTYDPVAQQTRFGWILLGGLSSAGEESAVATHYCSHDDDTAAALRRFWEWEEPQPVTLPLTEEEHLGETHFCDTHERLADGRFQVRLPFRTSPPTDLATTFRAAQRMLDTMGRRFERDDSFRRHYHAFMDEYLQLSHMSPAPPGPPPADGRVCYLPHHGVLKESEGIYKLRVE